MADIHPFLSLPLRHLHEENDENITLRQLQFEKGNPAMIIDLWHTKCSKCPAALAKMNDQAEEVDKSETLYISIALSQGEDNFDVARDVSEGQWDNLLSLFMDVGTKEQAKSMLEFSAVPYYIVIGKNGSLLGKGEPKHVNIEELLKSEAGENNTNSSSMNQLVLDEDF